MKSTQQKYDETKKTLKELEDQLRKENDKSKWIKIPEEGIEIQSKIHHKGKSYDELKEEFGEKYLEKHLPTYNQLQTLRNLEHKGKYKLGLTKTWEFVKQEDLISKKNGYVARFYANSGGAGLDCGEDSGYSVSDLGVRFVRRMKATKNSKVHKGGTKDDPRLH